MRKKLMQFGLSSILLVGVLTSCSKQQDTPAPSSSEKTLSGDTSGALKGPEPESQERYSYSGSGSTSTGTSTTVDRQKILTLVNNVRKTGCNCGGVQMPPVAPVTLNDQLNNAAQGHSNWMSANRKMSHTGANGSNPGTRITAAGYNWLTWAENVAMGFSSEDAVMKGWLGSSGHCKNIMNAKVKEMGIGRASGNYWTQDFATKR